MTHSIEIDSLIHEVIERHPTTDSMGGIEKLPAFRSVVVEYLKQSPDEAGSKTLSFIRHLNRLQMRIWLHQYGEYGVEWDRKWEKTRKSWSKKKERLEVLLREAADLFDSGQCDAGPHSSLAGYKEIDLGLLTVDEISWCGSDNLRRWAQIIAMSPVDCVFPVCRPHPSGVVVQYENIGRRGAASDPESAFRAMIVREITYHVPESVQYRYSTIAALAKFIGKSITRQNVRSILLKGHT